MSKAMVQRKAFTPNVNVRRVVKDVLSSRIEHKIAITSIAATQYAVAGVVQEISRVILAGDGLNQRAGDVILLEKLHILVSLANTTSTLVSQQNVRVIIFMDTIANGAVPAVIDVLDTAVPLSTYNPIYQQRSRFKILSDKIHSTVSETTTAKMSFDYHIPVNRKIYYNASGNTAADNGKNALFILIQPEATLAAGNSSWYASMTYTDA